jgi:hypothetical protein
MAKANTFRDENFREKMQSSLGQRFKRAGQRNTGYGKYFSEVIRNESVPHIWS